MPPLQGASRTIRWPISARDFRRWRDGHSARSAVLTAIRRGRCFVRSIRTAPAGWGFPATGRKRPISRCSAALPARILLRSTRLLPATARAATTAGWCAPVGCRRHPLPRPAARRAFQPCRAAAGDGADPSDPGAYGVARLSAGRGRALRRGPRAHRAPGAALLENAPDRPGGTDGFGPCAAARGFFRGAVRAVRFRGVVRA